MFGRSNPSSALTLLFLLAGAHLPSPSASSPVAPTTTAGPPRAADVPWMTAVGRRSGRDVAEGPGTDAGVEADTEEEKEEEEEEEEDDELFKDVDPRTLAAVLLEALNKSQTAGGRAPEERGAGGLGGGSEVQERREEDEEDDEEDGEDEEEEEEEEEDQGETTTEDQKEPGVRAAGEVNRERDRERPELELVMAAAALRGRGEREREEELERKKAQEEEERLTEKVTSRTVSHAVPVKTVQQRPGSTGEEMTGGESRAPGPASLSGIDGEPRNDEEEEQLNPEELKNLETMMKEFPSLGAASKRDDDDDDDLRDADGESLPRYKGKYLPPTKKKLRWQEETQKGTSFPSFRGGNFMDEFEEPRFNTPAPSSDTNDMMGDDAEGGDDEEEEEDEEREELSPEEEEAQAKAEQEEVGRQAAEVQQAKIEEEKLADIASDMLLRYMVKQNGGKRKYRQQSRKYASLLNTAEDKRSDEVQEAEEDDDDDIDPQTIDKLIEISSKLHLPADDVVDIIKDVEKKKKKDVPSEMASLSPWLRPSPSLSSTSIKGMSVPQMSINQNSYPSLKQTPQAVNPLKTWFQGDPGTKLALTNQDLWRKPLKPQKSLSTNRGFIAKPQRTFWGGYRPYTAYPRPYQKTPYRGYYPIYYAKPKPRYYLPETSPYGAFNNNNNRRLGNSVRRYDYNFPPRRPFQDWVQPRLRTPPAALQRSFYGNYLRPTYPRTFQRPTSDANPRSPSRLAGRPPQGRFYYAAPGPVASRDRDYYDPRAAAAAANQAVGGNFDDTDIQQMLTQRLRKFQ